MEKGSGGPGGCFGLGSTVQREHRDELTAPTRRTFWPHSAWAIFSRWLHRGTTYRCPMSGSCRSWATAAWRGTSIGSLCSRAPWQPGWRFLRAALCPEAFRAPTSFFPSPLSGVQTYISGSPPALAPFLFILHMHSLGCPLLTEFSLGTCCSEPPDRKGWWDIHRETDLSNLPLSVLYINERELVLCIEI